MSTISGVSGSSDPWGPMQAHRSQMQAKMFAKVDTDGSGGVDQAELKTMLSDISQKTGVSLDGDTAETFSTMDSNADGSLSSEELGQGMQSLMPPPPSTLDFAQMRSGDGAGGSQESQDDLFAQLDTDGDGKLTQAEFEAGRPQEGPQGANGAQGSAPPDGPSGPPPAGGPGGSGGAGTSESASSQTYDKLDTNQDGTVSELERLVGAMKDVATASKSDSQDNATHLVDVAKLAQQMYAQIAASLTEQSSNTLSVSA